MPKRGRYRGESRETDWFKRWRTGELRSLLMYLKKHKELSPSHPRCDELADLRGANLRKVKLLDARLSRCCLSEAEMYQAYLVGADISQSELMEVDLCDAKLRSTSMVSCSLVNANLKRADLAGADLRSADLTGASLMEANFYRTNIDGAVFDSADLWKAKALETTMGTPKSARGAFIDRESLQGSQTIPFGKLLADRGRVIDVQFEYDVALSFAGEDRPVAEAIAGTLRSQRISVFYDEYEKADLWERISTTI